uniref:Formate dehydrogenase major subunit n=1 Tax=Candidatus Kentrum sp. TUN TaxID=2126343 RepID=A0A451AS86_9GAMM|nr:MAG: formate dehydrogenase major subunit [Candidatus Kentron sp. TUN]VFK59908.1 MAG: formate dehydrogenase major subunit [Candidatus Kentron sp. TUN]VFK68911.1 MAG: formate dehydrogenase major subunit [Candidatus Kentron sp. TUN]
MPPTAHINNTPFPITPGETILDLARRTGHPIPTLCHAPNLAPFGSCRLCSVDVAMEKDGACRTVAACHTPIREGQYIYTDSPNVQRLRRNIMELVLTDHPMDCLTCEANGDCELQTVATQVGVRGIRYPRGKDHWNGKGPNNRKDTSHPYMTSDFTKCIRCFRCVRACDEVQGQLVLTMAGRGFDSYIAKGNNVSFAESDCVSCGACAAVCPTVAISDVFQSKYIRAENITRTVCTYCGVGCNLDVSTSNNKIVSIQAPHDAEVNSGHTCLKGRYAFEFLDHPDRLRSPMIKRAYGEFEEVSWEVAYDRMADEFRRIKEKHGPDAIAGISSARATNEENYLMQKFMRAVIGTNNIDCCARVCHSPTALGLQRAFGTGAATNSIADLDATDCILVIGANPTDAHPVTGVKIKQKLMLGVTGIVIDPREIELAKYARYHLQLRPGTNVALLNMMLHYIVGEGWIDEGFIDARVEGWDDFRRKILDIDPDAMEHITGVDKTLVEEAARAYAMADAAMEFHGLGVTEQKQGTATVQIIATLAMITGNVGKPGAGINPLRGQNNVQGAADMGCQPHQGAGYLDVTLPENHQRYNAFYGVECVSDRVGYKTPEMMQAAIDGKLKALWIIGEDVEQTDPDTSRVKQALQSLELLVCQEIFMTETAKMATVILPAAASFEKEGTFTNGERRIQRVQKIREPLTETKPDSQIIIDLMNRMGYPQTDYTPEGMLAEISRIVPFFAGVKWEELGDNGKQWPLQPAGASTEILHVGQFKRGKGKLSFIPFEESDEIRKYQKDYPYILTTNRELAHYNCGNMTRRTKNTEILGEDVLLMNPFDAAREGITEGSMVRVESPRGAIRGKAKLTDEVKPGILSTTFHFPETELNVITSDECCPETLCPEYKVVSCRVGVGVT